MVVQSINKITSEKVVTKHILGKKISALFVVLVALIKGKITPMEEFKLI